MKLVITVGNRLVEADAAGARVHDVLAGRTLPDGVELVEGGLAGLDLLGLVERSERVVFVDRVDGFGRPGDVVLLDVEQWREASAARFDHAGGLSYLLRALPFVCPERVPHVRVVGIEGDPTPAGVATAADLAVAAITDASAPEVAHALRV